MEIKLSDELEGSLRKLKVNKYLLKLLYNYDSFNIYTFNFENLYNIYFSIIVLCLVYMTITIFQPEGNLFADRMKSLEKRNIMEPRQEAK